MPKGPVCQTCQRAIESPGVRCESCAATYHQDCYPGRCRSCRGRHARALDAPVPEDLDELSDRELAALLASELKLPLIPLAGVEIPTELQGLLPVDYLLEKLVVPFSLENDILTVVIADPLDGELIADLERRTGYQIQVAVGELTGVREVLEQLLHSQKKS